ncbi:50S ribosomal protein L29 [Candidatus Woesearchaeota archaeon]|nr:50S ribosomal protein L29 [Candidatus Woesearchaeota archaeon]
MKDINPIKMSEQEIKAKVIELRKELIKLNAQAATGTTPRNPRQIKTTKKNIARLLTAMTAKELNK